MTVIPEFREASIQDPESDTSVGPGSKLCSGRDDKSHQLNTLIGLPASHASMVATMPV
jgi:hypothetical protein